MDWPGVKPGHFMNRFYLDFSYISVILLTLFGRKSMIDEINPVLYVMVRTDMPSMNNGKAQAHSGHAVSAFTYEAVIKPMKIGSLPHPIVERWIGMTSQGFGTQINLKMSYQDIVNVIDAVNRENGTALINPNLSYMLAELITDPEYPYLVPNKEIFDLIDSKHHTKEAIPLADGQYLCFRSEITSAYVFGDKSTEFVKNLLGGFPLHP